jgi:hypothetical protein
MMIKRTPAIPTAVLGVIVIALTGCSVHTSKSGDGSNKDVDIHSPFGSISVHEGGVEAKDLGLPMYPGARPRKGSEHDDNANVNISSSMFGVKVVVQRFETDDPPDKVLDFYQKPMSKFGKVIVCSGKSTFTHHRHGKDGPVTCDDSHGEEKELKVGTEDNQHVVAVKPLGQGCEFTLVYVRARDNGDTV